MDGASPNPTRTRTLKDGILQLQVQAPATYDELGNFIPSHELYWENVSVDVVTEEEFEPTVREWAVRKAELTVWSLDSTGSVSSLLDQIDLQQRFPSIAFGNTVEPVFYLSFIGRPSMVLRAADVSARQVWIDIIRKAAYELRPNAVSASMPVISPTTMYIERVSQVATMHPSRNNVTLDDERRESTSSLELFPSSSSMNRIQGEPEGRNEDEDENDRLFEQLSSISRSRLNDQRADVFSKRAAVRQSNSFDTSDMPPLVEASQSGTSIGGGRRTPEYMHDGNLPTRSSPLSPSGSRSSNSPTALSRITSFIGRSPSTPTEKDRKRSIQLSFSRLRARSGSDSAFRKKKTFDNESHSLEFASELLERYDEFVESHRKPRANSDAQRKQTAEPFHNVELTPEQRRDAFMLAMLNSQKAPKVEGETSQRYSASSALRSKIARLGRGATVAAPDSRTHVASLFENPASTFPKSPSSTPMTPKSMSGKSPVPSGDEELMTLRPLTPNRRNTEGGHYSIVQSAQLANSSIGEDRKLFELLGRTQSRRDDQRASPPPPPKPKDDAHQRSRSDEESLKRRRDSIKRQIEQLYAPTTAQPVQPGHRFTSSVVEGRRTTSVDNIGTPILGIDDGLHSTDTQANGSDGQSTSSAAADASGSTGGMSSVTSSGGRPALRLTGVRGIVSEGLNGYLHKRILSTFGRTAWLKRYYIIKDGLLMYRRKQEEGVLEFAANLANAKVKPILIPDRSWCFELVSPYKTFVLQAQTESQMKTWIQGIRRVGEELARYRPDGKIHFKCSYKNLSKRLCVTRNISLQALTDFLMAEFEIKEPCVVSYVDSDDLDLIFLRNQNDLDEAFLLHDQKASLRLYVTEQSSNMSDSRLLSSGSIASLDKTKSLGNLSAVAPTKINWVQGELIGAGSTGHVYLGLNIDSGRLMAVKQVEHQRDGDSNIKGRVLALMKEMEVLRNLHHPNIVQYIGMEHEGDVTNVFLEYVPGGSIHALLTKFGSFDEKLIRVYIRQVLVGLRYLHSNGLIHRDIKGANILVDTTGVVKLADFGMASKILAGVNQQLGSSNSNKIEMAGTPYWMAPEVIKRLSFGKSADIWSVGCTMIEMATGKPPWNHFSQEIAAIFHIANAREPPKAPSWLSATALDFLKLCLYLDPSERPDVEILLKHTFVSEPGAGDLVTHTLSRRESLRSDVSLLTTGKPVSISTSQDSVTNTHGPTGTNGTTSLGNANRAGSGATMVATGPSSSKYLAVTMSPMRRAENGPGEVVTSDSTTPAMLEEVVLHTGKMSTNLSRSTSRGSHASLGSHSGRISDPPVLLSPNPAQHMPQQDNHSPATITPLASAIMPRAAKADERDDQPPPLAAITPIQITTTMAAITGATVVKDTAQEPTHGLSRSRSSSEAADTPYSPMAGSPQRNRTGGKHRSSPGLGRSTRDSGYSGSDLADAMSAPPERSQSLTNKRTMPAVLEDITSPVHCKSISMPLVEFHTPSVSTDGRGGGGGGETGMSLMCVTESNGQRTEEIITFEEAPAEMAVSAGSGLSSSTGSLNSPRIGRTTLLRRSSKSVLVSPSPGVNMLAESASPRDTAIGGSTASRTNSLTSSSSARNSPRSANASPTPSDMSGDMAVERVPSWSSRTTRPSPLGAAAVVDGSSMDQAPVEPQATRRSSKRSSKGSPIPVLSTSQHQHNAQSDVNIAFPARVKSPSPIDSAALSGPVTTDLSAITVTVPLAGDQQQPSSSGSSNNSPTILARRRRKRNNNGAPGAGSVQPSTAASDITASSVGLPASGSETLSSPRRTPSGSSLSAGKQGAPRKSSRLSGDMTTIPEDANESRVPTSANANNAPSSPSPAVGSPNDEIARKTSKTKKTRPRVNSDSTLLAQSGAAYAARTRGSVPDLGGERVRRRASKEKNGSASSSRQGAMETTSPSSAVASPLPKPAAVDSGKKRADSFTTVATVRSSSFSSPQTSLRSIAQLQRHRSDSDTMVLNSNISTPTNSNVSSGESPTQDSYSPPPSLFIRKVRESHRTSSNGSLPVAAVDILLSATMIAPSSPSSITTPQAP